MSEADKIIEKIKEESKLKEKEIMAEAEKKSQEIIEPAEKKSRAIVDSIVSKGRKERELEKQRILANAKLRARKVKLDAKETVIQQVFKKAEEELHKITLDKKYPDILKVLIKEAIDSIGEGELEIVARKEDAEIFGRGFLKGLGNGIEISGKTMHSLGVVVRTKDGKIEVDNTFATRLERMKEDLRSHAAKVLFKA